MQTETIHYLSVHDLLVIHQGLLERFGGLPGITEAGFTRLEAAVATPRQSAFGADLYPELPDKAAALAHAIIRNHPFSDGNKRVAVSALDIMLSMNGARLAASNDELYRLAMRAAEQMSRDEMIAWVHAQYHKGQGDEVLASQGQPGTTKSEIATQHLTLGDIVDMRDAIGAADPWRFEIVNGPGLLSALTTPFQAAFGQQAFPGLIDKAAALIFLLIANHPFRDGNKRIAGAALRLFLARNGLELLADSAELRLVTRLITTTHDPRDPQLTGWIAAHTRPMPPAPPAIL